MSGEVLAADAAPVVPSATPPVPQPGARVFAQLKWRLVLGSLHGDTGRLVGFVAGLVLAAGFAPVGFIAFALLRGSGALATDIGVVVYTVIAVGWVLLSLLIFGIDETLDPTRLVLFPLTRGTVARGMFVAALVGVPPLGVFVVLAGSVIGMSGGPASVLVALVAVALELSLCITLSRALGAALSGLLRSRRGRDLAMLAGLVVILGVEGANVALRGTVSSGLGSMEHTVHVAAGALRWSPPGLLAHAVGDARTGDLARAGLELAVVAGLVAALWWLWMVALGHTLVSPDSSTQGVGARRGRVRGRRGALPGSAPLRGVLAKELRYNWRDPRRKVGWLSMCGVGAIVVFSIVGSHASGGALPSLCFAALAIGLQEANQFGIDGSPVWMNIAAATSFRDMRTDLAGRNLAHALVAVPCLAGLGALVAVLSGAGPVRSATDVAVATGVFGITLGIANLLSVLLPYSMPRRIGSPFGGSGAGRGCLTGLASSVAMVVTSVLALPLVLAVVLRLRWPVLLVAAPGYGLCWAWAGRTVASRVAFRRLPELLAAISREH